MLRTLRSSTSFSGNIVVLVSKSTLALATPGCDLAHSRYLWTSAMVDALTETHPLAGSVNRTVS